MAQHGATLERISYEITQDILGPANLSQRKGSFDANPAHGQQSDVLNNDNVAGGLTFEGSNKQQRHIQSSGTWTTLSREAWSDQDEIEDREVFIEEYNRLAKKHNVRLLRPEDYNTDSSSISDKPVTWFSRVLHRTSSTHSTKPKAERQLRHKRSISDITLRRASKTKTTLKDKSLQDLVRLCGLSLLYLPTEYAPCSLAVPTCFRATAQYLVQHGPGVPGVFRIPGSNNAIAALYSHYCTRDEESMVASTVRCPTLPSHITYDVHDVASTFKRFLSGLPGGILGSLAIFDAFVSIQNQLHTDPELPARRRSQIRSKLIALAIATLKSQYRREVICAVFGLLSMIGHVTENSCKSEQGDPLPPSDLMGYGPLGIVFGPLLIGDLIDNYNMRLPNPFGGLILLPITPPRSRKEKQNESQKSNMSSHETLITTNMDKIKVVNSITEMLIIHWQDVVTHLKTSQALRVVGRNRSLANNASKRPFLRPSASEAFAPHTWGTEHNKSVELSSVDDATSEHNVIFSPRRRRSRSQPAFGKRLSGAKSMNTLSKTVEECVSDVSTTPDPSNFPSHTVKVPDTHPDDSGSIKLFSTTSDQDGIEKSAPRKWKSGPKIRSYTGKNQDRVLRLPRRQLTHSVPEDYAPQPEEMRSPSIGPPSPKLRHSERASQPAENMDYLNKAPPQEDLASLAEFARVLLQDSQNNEAKPHNLSRLDTEKDKDSSSMEATPRNPIATRKESFDSSSSSVQKLFPAQRMSVSKTLESSGSSSSPLSMFLSRRRRGANKQTSSNMVPTKSSESTPTVPKVQEHSMPGSNSLAKTSGGFPVTGLSKTAVLQREIESPIRASPRGTVKALVAKFSLGYSPLTTYSPTTKASVADAQVSQQSPKGSIVSPYTRNPPSPSRSQRSGRSVNQAREVRSPPKVDLHLNSSKHRSPFRTPVSQKLFQSSVNTKSPSHSAPRSQEKLPVCTQECSIYNHGQSCQSELGASLDLPVEVRELVKEAYSLQQDSSDRHATFGDPDPVIESINQKTSLVSTKSNSVLHGQIQSLQQQLAAKTEEVQQLRHQLEARSNQEMSTLAENIKEARRDIQFWKSRAELYEKQVEIMRKTSSRANSGQLEKQPFKSTSRSGQSSMNYSENGRVVEYQSGKALHGIDGAASWDSRSSEKSSRGRLHGIQSIASTSENGNWLEQTMRALHTTEP